jgi:hypothetical protein
LTGAAAEDGSGRGETVDHERPDGVSDATVEALGKVSEAWEFVERARGHLFSLHQLMGHADLLFGDAADLLRDAGHEDESDRVREEVVGRNILDGRWTFQVVDEFEDCYYQPVRSLVKDLERDLIDGRRHVYEAEMKDDRRTRGREGHERRPPKR